MTSTLNSREHAVVIGSGMAGLLAARVLSDSFGTVTIIERDELPTHWANRRGIPQGRHVHTLLPRGREVIERLLPGLTGELIAGGAPTIERLDDLWFDVLGHRLCDGHGELSLTLQASRPYLEGRIRARVGVLPNVRIRDDCTVAGPMSTPDRHRITGVRIVAAAGVPEEHLAADLVVDASGRAGRTPAWLAELGFGLPPEEQTTVRLTYVSQQLRVPPGYPIRRLCLIGPRPGRPTGMALFAYENDTWTFTALGLGPAAPTATRESMLATIEPFAPVDVYDALAAAAPLTEPVAYRYPASVRRHYEVLGNNFPQGLLVVGDAQCSFNPIYGQGMTVAALDAETLEGALAEGDNALARRFFAAAAKPRDVAWQLAVGSDLALPEVEGERSRQVRVVNSWVARVLTVAEYDEVVARQFLRVTALLDPPQYLFHAGIVRRVLFHQRARSASPASVPAA